MLAITDLLLDNYNRPRTNLKELRAIVVHWTANKNIGANAVANRNYFNTKPYIKDQNGKKVFASAHFIVDDRRIVRCIPENEVAYHCGAKVYKPLVANQLRVPLGDSPNNYTIGIEMCVNADGDFSITRQNTIELLSHLLNKYRLTTQNVYRHFDITGKECPKMMLDDAIWKSFLTTVDTFTKAGKYSVNTATLNVRTGPGTNFSIKRAILAGEVVEKLEQKGIWYRIADNEWVSGEYLMAV